MDACLSENAVVFSLSATHRGSVISLMPTFFHKIHKKYSATPIASMFIYMLNLILAWAFIPAATIWA